MNSYSLYNEMRYGALSQRRWVKPHKIADYYNVSMQQVIQCLSRMVYRGEVVKRPDKRDRRRSEYCLKGGV